MIHKIKNCLFVANKKIFFLKYRCIYLVENNTWRKIFYNINWHIFGLGGCFYLYNWPINITHTFFLHVLKITLFPNSAVSFMVYFKYSALYDLLILPMSWMEIHPSLRSSLHLTCSTSCKPFFLSTLSNWITLWSSWTMNRRKSFILCCRLLFLCEILFLTSSTLPMHIDNVSFANVICISSRMFL